MKELSVEQKAKAYDEALKVLHKYDGANIMFSQSLKEEMFPELKESEEEKIRKWLICTLKSLNSTAVQIDGAYEMMLPAIAWLEKQGKKGTKRNNEEIPNSDWSEEDEKILSDIIKDLVHPWNEYIPDRIEDEIKWLKNKLNSLRPQNRWKPSDEQIKGIECAIKTLQHQLNVGDKRLNSLYNDLKKLREE